MHNEATTLTTADSLVATREENGQSSDARFHEGCVTSEYVLRAGLLLLIVALANAVHEWRILKTGNLIDPVEERKLISIYYGQRNLRSDSLDVFNVKFSLD